MTMLPTLERHPSMTTQYAPMRDKVIGHRAIMNTQHPIWAELRRFGPKQWVVAIVCNGIAETSRSYPTRRQALAAYDAYSAMGSAQSLAAITVGRLIQA